MIEIKPVPYSSFTCPKCNHPQAQVEGTVWASIQPMASCTCKACSHPFYATFPVSHAITQVTAINQEDFSLTDISGIPREKWLHPHLSTIFSHTNEREIPIRKIINRHCDQVVILNTLDFLYGHVLLKLLNADHYLNNPDLGLVLIVPKMYEWLIPEGCAEVWIVDIKLKEGLTWMPALDEFIQDQLPRFKEAYLSKAFSHPDMSGVEISRYSKIKPFDMAKFAEIPPQVTFVVREDRVWFSGPWEDKLFRVAKKLRVEPLKKWFLYRQVRRFRRVIRKICQAVPGLEAYVVGLGTTGSFGQDATDLRTDRMSKEKETGWCMTYAASHLVIGIHGSNMLLPTAHAGGCIEILPEDRYGNMVQDIFVRYNDRRQVYLYRFTREFASPGEVASHAVAILTDYEDFYESMITQTHTYNKYKAELW